MSTAFYHNPTTKINSQPDTRLVRAQALLASGAVRPTTLPGHVFAAWVRSQSNPAMSYLTTLGAESCSCMDYVRHGIPHKCKHLIACRRYYVQHWEAGR